MLQFSPIRAIVIAVVAIVGILTMLPSFLPQSTVDAMPDFLPKQQIVLGLDLQGGSHLLLQVNRDDIVKQRLAELRQEARRILANENGIGHFIHTNQSDMNIELTDPSQVDAAMSALTDGLQTEMSSTLFNSGGGVQEATIVKNDDNTITIALTDRGIEERMSSLVTQSIEVIRRRIDEVGTTEPTIQRQGADRILVEVPGFSDSARLKELISKTARLTFHLVYPSMTAAQAQAQGLPEGTMIVPSKDGGSELLYEDVALGGESLVDAQPGFDQQTSQAIVTFRFDTQGSIKFGEITSANVGRRFAIVLDNQVITAPVIQSAITGGTGQIQGSFTPQSANDLAVLLRAGALPATLDIIEERSVGPSLGADSVRAGVTAGIVGAILVVIFMMVAYGLFGIFANIALALNVVLVLGALSMLGATLTLPGIAGIVLTVGMAVDSNVLIFERIREELNAGRTGYQALEAGFQRAMSTIIDANVTTLIAAVVLFFLGSGPVQGFAVTLALGILTTMFTAYFVTQFIVGRWYSVRRPKSFKVHLLSMIPDGTKIPFMKWRRRAISLSLIGIVFSIGMFAFHGLNLGIDFKGGSSLLLGTSNGVVTTEDVADVRASVQPLNLGDVVVQTLTDFATGKQNISLRIEAQPGGDTAQQAAVKSVGQALDTAKYTVLQTEVVGPTVSSELAISGAIGVLVAIIGVLIYIWFRFEWQFAVGAIVALVHDVILTIGMFSLVGFEFNLSSIAAILTIVGYSLNDTVVVYDRVREYLRKYRKISVAELIDMSINTMLSRTTMTSFTTILALLALVFFGGEVIRGFTVAMTWGVFVGTYSSIFIAAPILIFFGLKTRANVDEKKQEEKRADGAAV